MVLRAKKQDAPSQVLKKLLDPKTDIEFFKMTLTQLCMEDTPANAKLIEQLRALASKNIAEHEYIKKIKQLDEIIEMLNAGPLRLGTYIGSSPPANGKLANRVHVLMENGDTAFPAVLDKALFKSLQSCDSVLLDAQARAVTMRGPAGHDTGEIAELVRRLDDDRVRVKLNDLNSKEVYRISQTLKDQFAAGTVEPGSELLVCTRRRIAFEILPPEDGLAHYRFLERSDIPVVDAHRDIGCPPSYIEELVEHVRDELTAPELGRKYRVRRMQTRLLKGVTGTGKTLSILATINGINQVVSEVTGAPVDALPNRVCRLRSANYLNKYVGESDKLLDRFFNEVLKLANEPFVWQGRTWYLPVIARCEEIDALARARHGAEDVMGRIQTTALERLDHLADDLGNKLCIFLFTTNTPEICDQAFLRRAGGKIVDFGRLRRGQFHAILTKKIRGLPLHKELGADHHEAERQLARDVTNWLFSANGNDPGQVELTFAGSATPTIKFRRDILTGSIVDLSVQQACQEAKTVERQGTATPGVTTHMMMSAFDKQIRGICEQITEHNSHNYLTLPDGSRVASVRRIEQPAVQGFELERSDG